MAMLLVLLVFCATCVETLQRLVGLSPCTAEALVREPLSQCPIFKNRCLAAFGNVGFQLRGQNFKEELNLFIQPIIIPGALLVKQLLSFWSLPRISVKKLFDFKGHLHLLLVGKFKALRLEESQRPGEELPNKLKIMFAGTLVRL